MTKENLIEENNNEVTLSKEDRIAEIVDRGFNTKAIRKFNSIIDELLEIEGDFNYDVQPLKPITNQNVVTEDQTFLLFTNIINIITYEVLKTDLNNDLTDSMKSFIKAMDEINNVEGNRVNKISLAPSTLNFFTALVPVYNSTAPINIIKNLEHALNILIFDVVQRLLPSSDFIDRPESYKLNVKVSDIISSNLIRNYNNSSSYFLNSIMPLRSEGALSIERFELNIDIDNGEEYLKILNEAFALYISVSIFKGLRSHLIRSNISEEELERILTGGE